jgi:hypothetical protein
LQMSVGDEALDEWHVWPKATGQFTWTICFQVTKYLGYMQKN